MRNSMPYLLLKTFRKNKLRSLEELDRSQWLPLSEIRKIQEGKFLRLMRHCRKNVPYYKDALREVRSLEDITKLPFLTKKDIRDHCEDLKAMNLPGRSFVPNSTSGSTGQSLRFFSDIEDSIDFGILMRGNMWAGWRLDERQAFLWGSHYDISQAKKLFSKIKNLFIHKILYLSSYNMTETSMLNYRKRINDYKPKLITGYPSGLAAFADFLGKEGLNIHRPKGIICSGETLYEYQREKIESFFKSRVFNRYGCREAGNIAHQCDRGDGLHINAEHVIVEIVDEKGNSCKSGEQGELVITDLDNYAFPFIRYKIKDIGILRGTPCSCGRDLPLIKNVEGRAFDIVLGINGNRLTGNYWTVLLRTFVNGIRRFQVIQENREAIILKLIVDDHFNDSEKRKLVREILNKCGRDMKVKIEIVKDIPLTESGKNRFIISKVSPFVT